MKILKKGNTGPIWIGKKLTCGNCGTKIQLEKEDKVKEAGSPIENYYLSIKCPICRHAINWDM